MFYNHRKQNQLSIEEQIMVKEIIFMVEEAPEGGYTAQALGYSIFTEADTWDELKEAVQDAVRCHFDENEKPAVLRLHPACGPRRGHAGMRLPRDLSGEELASLLQRYSYEITRQTGSHMRLTTLQEGEHHITIPRHASLRVGTLNAILKDVAQHLGIERDALVNSLLEK
jgi:predicted RNA binding protein YcfA (HicA-like mRNA interferase family)